MILSSSPLVPQSSILIPLHACSVQVVILQFIECQIITRFYSKSPTHHHQFCLIPNPPLKGLRSANPSNFVAHYYCSDWGTWFLGIHLNKSLIIDKILLVFILFLAYMVVCPKFGASWIEVKRVGEVRNGALPTKVQVGMMEFRMAWHRCRH